ncbi:Phytochrome, two-component sensor histidine kinase [Fulvivirga imtechensis AK7]|uniref:histidine kinase n=2 Tax=Fulvivirga TaxID=396811 RepID=L8JWC4_9BACT|nr:Phytochrome, two-component sensor histidine kinase [Fulvivirga imtechensis AK7]
MAWRDIPIQRKLMRAILLTSGSVLLLTCSAYFAYEYFTFRQTTVRQLSVLGEIIATNSTAALAFDSRDDAYEILASLKAQPHIVAASIYDKNGDLFTHYPRDLTQSAFPLAVKKAGYHFKDSYLVGVEPIVQLDNQLGTLYLKSDLGAMYSRLKLYGSIVLLVIAVSVLLAYVLSKRMQQAITRPILSLANTAKAISERQDYTVRANKLGNDELGLLTDAFNHMLTEILERNQKIQAFNQELEQKIADRTSQLEDVNKELESFSYSVSHDLRAPLRSIDGYSRILIEDYYEKLDDEGQRVLNIIIKNALKMGRLIDDLLAFSRVGKQELSKVMLDMEALTQIVVHELEASQQNKELCIAIHPMPKVEGDSAMMRQVLTNLISNAIKYSMKKENPVIEIGCQAQNEYYVYYVKDNGAGFDMRYYDKLFGVFQRLHSESEFEGTGVGLALVHRVISKHGGEVWAEGKVDEGATFYFSLPVSDSDANKNHKE